MQWEPNVITQTRRDLGDIRFELWAIGAGIVVPNKMPKAKAVAHLRDKEKMAVAIISSYEKSGC
jgi:hypothetical protein